MTDPQVTATPRPWVAHGSQGGVACSTPEATRAGFEVLNEGGSAVDAFIAAAFVQTVLENGSTSASGAFFLQLHRPGAAAVEFVEGVLGPAAADDYAGYDARGPDRFGGRGMPAPGFVAGAWQAHQEFGRLSWARLLAPACHHAQHGFTLGGEWCARLRSSPDAVRDRQARQTWIQDGTPVRIGALIRQPELARTLEEIAAGPDDHFTGQFAREYVQTAKSLGGKLELSDLARWRERVRRRSSPLDTDFGGGRVASRGTELSAFAYQVAKRRGMMDHGANSAEAIDLALRAWGRAFRLRQHMPLDAMLDPGVIEREANSLMSAPRDPVDMKTAFGTNGVVAIDAQGQVANGVHTINCPHTFGGGIMVGGAYASYVTGHRHATTGDVFVSGVSAAFMVIRDGRVAAAAASPGFSCMLAPWQFIVNVLDFGMDAEAAVLAPRFGVATPLTENLVPLETGLDDAVFQRLRELQCPHLPVSMMGSAQGGLVTGFCRSEDDRFAVVQDPRRDAIALAS